MVTALWATALFAAYWMFSLYRLSVDVPYWDQWNFVDFLRSSDDGLNWGEIWKAHNEHRVLVPNLVLLGLARLTNWNVRAEIALTHALIGLRFLIVLLATWIVGRRAKQATWVCLPLLTALLLTRAQAENFMWGWQVTLTLGALFTLLCCLVLVNGGWPRFTLAAAFGLLSQFSFASGVVLWPIGAAFIAVQPGLTRRTRMTRMGVWLGIGAVATFFYRQGLLYPTKTLPRTPELVVEYSVKFLGTPMAPLRSVPAELIAWRAGVIGLALFALSVLGVVATKQFTRWAPIVMWGLTAPATAVVTALGRLGFVPVPQSMSSRYVTMSITMWASTLILFTSTILHVVGRWQTRKVTPMETRANLETIASIDGIANPTIAQTSSRPRLRGARLGLAVLGTVLICALAFGSVGSANGWDAWAKRRQTESLRDRAFLADEAQLTPEHKSWMYPDPAMIDKQRPYLIDKRLSVFRKRPKGAPALVSSTTVPSTTVPSTTAASTTAASTAVPSTAASSTPVPSTKMPTSAVSTAVPTTTVVGA